MDDITRTPSDALPETAHLTPGEEEAPLGGETVDDILRDIMREDGTFNDQFNELYARYNGGTPDALRVSDISDRSDDAPPPAAERVEYEEAPARPPVREPDTAQRISSKLPPEVREVVTRETYDSTYPAFSHDGTVRYPAMGVGEAEERVVYDADWEERARRDAARRERARREQMLRGDSAYVRDFRFSSSDERYGRPNVNPSFIDPLDDSQDEPLFTSRRVSAAQQQRKRMYDSPQQKETKAEKPFFPQGFPERKSEGAVAGKTVNRTEDSREAVRGTDISMGAAARREPAPDADSAVLAAFSAGREAENAFHARWDEVARAAAQRRDQRAAEETRLHTVRQAQAQQEARARRVAAAERRCAEESLPLELDTRLAGADFEEIPVQIEPDAAIYPAAERIAAPEPAESGQKSRAARRGKHRKKKDRT